MYSSFLPVKWQLRKYETHSLHWGSVGREWLAGRCTWNKKRGNKWVWCIQFIFLWIEYSLYIPLPFCCSKIAKNNCWKCSGVNFKCACLFALENEVHGDVPIHIHTGLFIDVWHRVDFALAVQWQILRCSGTDPVKQARQEDNCLALSL